MNRHRHPDEPLRFEECWDEITRLQGKYPSLRRDLEAAIAYRNDNHSIQRLLQWLQAFEKKHLRLNIGFLTIESHDEALCNSARELAHKTERAIFREIGELKRLGYRGNYCQRQAWQLLFTLCEGMEITPPTINDLDDKHQVAAALMRAFNERWWRRKLRTLQARKLEIACRYLGAVCKKRGGYCSDATLRRRTRQKQRNRELLEKLEAINDQGQRYTLAELSDLGVSNPVNRRNELMTRIRGFEEYAEDFPDYIPVFITQTCPSRFHSHHRSGSTYDNWNRSTPREAQAYLTDVWAKVRAAWKKEHIECFGLRVAEPHHDACPHWHLLLWFPKTVIKRALSIYRHCALQDSPNEAGAAKRRFTIKRDELAKGATGYIAKYISKNIDGLTENGEAWNVQALKSAARIEAWASTWGIRQFQQLGGPSVTVWRESRRLSASSLREQTENLTPELAQAIQNIMKAADQSDWKQFTHAMGGAILPRKERPLRAYMIKKLDDTGEAIKNAYGETIEQLKGLFAFGTAVITTHLYDWTIQPIKPDKNTDDPTLRPLDLCQ